MKLNFKSIMALMLCVVMMLGVMTACNNEPVDDETINESDDRKDKGNMVLELSGVDTSKVNYYIPSENPVGYIDNNGEKLVPEYLMKINGIPVTVEEFRYPYLNIKYTLDGGDDSLWAEDAPEETRLTAEDIEELTEQAVEYVKQTTLYQILAAKYGLEITEDEKEEINSSIQETIDAMNAEGSTLTYEQALEESYYSDGLYRYTMDLYTIASKVYNHLYFSENAPLGYTPDEMLKALTDDGYVRTQQLLVKFPDAPTEGTEDEIAAAVEQGKKDAKAKAEQALAKIKNGEDFMTVVKEYNEDPGMDIYGEDGYYFNAGVMVKEYEEASFALEEGGVSEIVETPYGYHIIKRLPLESEFIAENAGTYLGEIYSLDFSDRLMATFDTMTVEFAPEFDLVSPTTLK